MKKILILCLIVCSCFSGWSQSTINDYKYVIIPLQYEFLKGQNAYRLNTVTKLLFKQHGFDAYFEKSELPQDLFEDRCLAMYADVHKVRGGFRKTRLEVSLKDCYGELIMKSEYGQSGENNHEKRHQKALTEAFKSIKALNYKYKPKSDTETTVVTEQENQIENKIDKVEDVQNIEKIKEVKEVKVTEEAEEAEEVVNDIAVVKMVESEVKKEKASEKTVSNVLYPNPITNGYEVRDEDKKIVMVLLNTAAKNVFIVKGKSAIVFKDNNTWKYSENNGTTSNTKNLNIKF